MRYLLLPRRITLLMYTDDSINYSSSCQININGRRATIDTVNGKDFFKFMKDNGRAVLHEELGLEEIGAAVGAPMLRLIKRLEAPLNIAVEVDPKITYAGDIPLYWINIGLK